MSGFQRIFLEGALNLGPFSLSGKFRLLVSIVVFQYFMPITTGQWAE